MYLCKLNCIDKYPDENAKKKKNTNLREFLQFNLNILKNKDDVYFFKLKIYLFYL